MKVSGALLKVLGALLSDGPDTYGLDLVRRTGLKSGTVYPILDRLQTMGWLTSRWEDVDPKEAGRPRKRLYTVTGEGAHEGRQLLLEYTPSGVWA